MEIVVRTDLCAKLGVRLTDLSCGSGAEEFRLCGHMEAGQDYQPDPRWEPVVVADLLDREGQVLDNLRAWHRGIFSKLGFSTFCLSTKGLNYLVGGRPVWSVSLYVVLEEKK